CHSPSVVPSGSRAAIRIRTICHTPGVLFEKRSWPPRRASSRMHRAGGIAVPDSAQYYRGRPRHLDGDQPTPWKPETRFFAVESWGRDVSELGAPSDEIDAATPDDADIELRVGYVDDYISGLPVRATPEEV